MLALTRRIGESFLVGEDVVITVFHISGNQVRLGVEAPLDVGIHREEPKRIPAALSFPPKLHRQRLSGE